MKKKLWIAFLILALLILLNIHATNLKANVVSFEVQDVFLNYLETIKSDYVKAANEYCHFEMPIIKELVMQSNDYLLSYQVIKWEQISEVLWAVEVSITSTYSDENNIYNFVGFVDGEWRVMLNPYQIPAYMLRDLDLAHYSTTGEKVIPYEAVIGLDE